MLWPRSHGSRRPHLGCSWGPPGWCCSLVIMGVTGHRAAAAPCTGDRTQRRQRRRVTGTAPGGPDSPDWAARASGTHLPPIAPCPPTSFREGASTMTVRLSPAQHLLPGCFPAQGWSQGAAVASTACGVCVVQPSSPRVSGDIGHALPRWLLQTRPPQGLLPVRLGLPGHRVPPPETSSEAALWVALVTLPAKGLHVPVGWGPSPQSREPVAPLSPRPPEPPSSWRLLLTPLWPQRPTCPQLVEPSHWPALATSRSPCRHRAARCQAPGLQRGSASRSVLRSSWRRKA